MKRYPMRQVMITRRLYWVLRHGHDLITYPPIPLQAWYLFRGAEMGLHRRGLWRYKKRRRTLRRQAIGQKTS